jgi:hypothetical protein
METRAPSTDFLHACFRANLNFKRTRTKGMEEASKKSKQTADYNYELVTNILSICLILSPGVPNTR